MDQRIAYENIRHHPASNCIIMNLLDSGEITGGARSLGSCYKHELIEFDLTCPQRSINVDSLIWKSMSGES
ncbi:hypothetical protein Lal_00023366 [Lupinus albus]|nr:hypothetical protein Lal_00023366 [Lupinus albus]